MSEFEHEWVPKPGNEGDAYPMWCDLCHLDRDYAIRGYYECTARMRAEIVRLRGEVNRVRTFVRASIAPPVVLDEDDGA